MHQQAMGRGRDGHAWPVLVGVFVSVVLAVVAGATSVKAGEPCKVRDAGTDQRFARLQPAIEAAAPGATLEVRGTCRGQSTVDRDLVIRGHWTKAWGRAELRGTRAGVFTLTVEPANSLTLTMLTIVGNRADRNGDGGGVDNRGSTIFKSTRVQGPTYGTAVVNEGSLTLSGRSRIGDSVFNEGEMTFNHQSRYDGRRREHDGPYAPQGITNAGQLTFNDRSSVVDTLGEGIHSGWGRDRSATVELNDESRIARHEKAGIWSRGPVVMNDSSRISSNGGSGVSMQGSILTLNDRSVISHNRGYQGAGVFLRNAILEMSDASRIRHNRAKVKAGGVYVGDSTLVGVRCGPGPGANVRANSPRDCYTE